MRAVTSEVRPRHGYLCLDQKSGPGDLLETSTRRLMVAIRAFGVGPVFTGSGSLERDQIDIGASEAVEDLALAVEKLGREMGRRCGVGRVFVEHDPIQASASFFLPGAPRAARAAERTVQVV